MAPVIWRAAGGAEQEESGGSTPQCPTTQHLRNRYTGFLCRSQVQRIEDGLDVLCVKYPVLLRGQDEFVYENCTPLPEGTGFVQGPFSFVPNKLNRPEEELFEVTVAPFPLGVREYIF